MKRFCYIALLLLLSSCQIYTGGDVKKDKSLEQVRSTLESEVNNYINVLDPSRGKDSTIIIVDPESGYGYADDFGFKRVNAYKPDGKGAMRN